MRPLVLLAPLLLAAAFPAAALAAPECAPSCTVYGAVNAFLSPVTVVLNGGTVTWTAVDQGHTATSSQQCLNLPFVTSRSASFRIEDGTLYARAVATGVEKPCPEAVALPDGSRQLDYICVLHPQMRIATLVVNP